MAWHCFYCDHRSCMNGESGIGRQSKCNECEEFIMLCSNDLTDTELENRCNGEACGCFDDINCHLCPDCKIKQ